MRYAKAKTAQEAATLLSQEPGVTRVLAGGTDVMVQLKARLVEPALVVDIKHIPGIRDITAEAGGYRIGAAVSGAELGEHAGFCALWPGVVEGFELIGSTQVQGRATMVGNLCNASPAGDAVPAWWPHRPWPASSGRTAPATARWPIFPPDRARPRWPRARSSPRSCCPHGPRGRRRLSALHPAHRDGYRGGLGRGQPDAGCLGHLHRRPRGAGRGGADGAAGGPPLPTRSSAPGWTMRRWPRWPRPASAACKPIDDKRGTVEFRTQVAGVLARRAALTRLFPRRRTEMKTIHVSTTVNGDRRRIRLCARRDPAGRAAQPPWPDRRQGRLRHRRLRRLLGDSGRAAGLLLPGAGGRGRRRRDRDHRGHGGWRQAAPAATGLHRPCRPAMRHLHAGHPGRRQGAAGQEPRPERDRGIALLAGRQSLPLHRIRQDRPRGAWTPPPR